MTDKVKVRCSVCGNKMTLHIEADDKEELACLKKDIQFQQHICEKCKE